MTHSTVTLHAPADLSREETAEQFYLNLERVVGPRKKRLVQSEAGKAKAEDEDDGSDLFGASEDEDAEVDKKAEAAAKKKAAAAKKKAAAAKKKAAADAKKKAEAGTELTAKALKDAMNALFKSEGRDAVKTILDKYKAKKLDEVEESDWPDLAIDLAIV